MGESSGVVKDAGVGEDHAISEVCPNFTVRAERRHGGARGALVGQAAEVSAMWRRCMSNPTRMALGGEGTRCFLLESGWRQALVGRGQMQWRPMGACQRQPGPAGGSGQTAPKAACGRRHAGGTQRLSRRELVATRRVRIIVIVGAAGAVRDLGKNRGESKWLMHGPRRRGLMVTGQWCGSGPLRNKGF
jgi:hypothetical protein